MAKKGLGTVLKIGVKTTASGAGSLVTTLNVTDDIFLDAFAGESITVGGSTTTIASVTDANTVELAAAQTWSDGDTVTLDAKEITDQRSLSFPRGADMIDVTTKSSDDVREILSGFRSGTFSVGGIYNDGDVSQLYVLQAALKQSETCKFVFQVDDAAGATYDKEGDCYLTRFNVGFPYEDASGFTFDFTVTGAIS